MKFEFSKQQKEAVRRFNTWMAGSGQLFRIHGFAGTGKTTLVKKMTAGSGEVVFLAPTGKAASVLARRGCAGARTIHSFIYVPVGELAATAKALRAKIGKMEASDPENVDLFGMRAELATIRSKLNNPSWSLRGELDPKPDLIVVDEASMVADRVAEDLMSFGIKVVALGDPGQ
ncbi:MAG: AAA family ATPase, partial [Alphaproteobacteria bacterium]|nr:AAA family ATPase [Alphaproteobacteria bacterium]